MNVCKLDGCNGPTRGTGWCSYHRANWQQYGTPTPKCVAPGCARGRGKNPYCFAHQRNLAKYGTLEKPPRLPAGPLLDYVTLRGGVGAVISAAGYRKGTPVHDQMQKRFERVAAEGSASPALADRIAVEVLRVHPSFIWGDVWFLDVLVDLEEEEPQAVAS